MGTFDRQIASAKRMISKYGQTITWRKTAIVANPTEPWKPSNGTVTDYTPKMVFITDYKDQVLLKYILNTEIPYGDTYGLMAQQTFSPAINDVVIRSGKTYVIHEVNTISPNGEQVLHVVRFKV